jgi:hypothetical protein
LRQGARVIEDSRQDRLARPDAHSARQRMGLLSYLERTGAFALVYCAVLALLAGVMALLF